MHSKVIKMEIVCEKHDVDKIVNIIQVSARTGKSGDGLIYVSDVGKAYKNKDWRKGKPVSAFFVSCRLTK